ncbi:MAG: hypothetical protein ACP5FR_01290 [Candidatus Micrarchaeia archaeon]
MKYAVPLALVLVLLVLSNYSVASYTVTHLNVTVQLNKNTSASVSEILTLHMSNQSVSQYSTDRLALNLTLSTPILVEHILNPRSGVYNFKFLPGAAFKNDSGYYAYLMMSYDVNNVTEVNQTGPRSFLYSFNDNVFNFEHGISGQVLPQNTTLTIVIPQGASIVSVYPVPDMPTTAFTDNYKNVTSVSWMYGEPLSAFVFKFSLQESIETEVTKFFYGVYNYFGYSIFAILIILIILILLYIYLRVK